MLVLGQELVERDDERWVVDDPRLAVDQLGQLVERLEAVFRPSLRDVLLEPCAPFLADLVAVPLDDLVDGEAGIPDVEVAHGGERRHRRPVRAAPVRL